MKNKYIALFKLELLRDVYRQGWKPDYTDNQPKYIIVKENNEISNFWKCSASSHFLSFQSMEIRDKFLKNFETLIQEIEDLI